MWFSIGFDLWVAYFAMAKQNVLKQLSMTSNNFAKFYFTDQSYETVPNVLSWVNGDSRLLDTDKADDNGDSAKHTS